MQFQFQATTGLIAASMRLQSRRIFIALWSGFLCSITLVFLTRDHPMTACSILGIALSGILAAGGGWFLSWGVLVTIQAWLLHRQNPLLFGGTVFSTDTAGIEFKTGRQIYKFAWQDIVDVRENRAIFLIRLGKTAGMPVPKAGMPDDLQEELRSEFARHVIGYRKV